MNYGRYQIIKELGKGSMGVVYQAHDPNLDIQVALKVLRPDRVVSEAFVKRFLAEAKALGRLDHPNIVRVYNVDEAEGTVYIAMEFIEGESLTDVMQGKRFSPEEIAEIGATVAETLDYAHQKGIVHRDVKPSNILIRPDGRLKITDFGIARIEDPTGHQQTQAGEILGTPAYMSPEQVESHPVDGRSDLFSLGIILYELSAGARPFKGESLAGIFNSIIKETPRQIQELTPSIPRELSQVIMKCLQKSPAERFATGRALAAALKDCVVKKEAVTAATPAAESRTKTTVIAAVIMITLVIVGGVFYSLKSKNAEAPPVEKKVVLASLKVDSSPGGANVFINNALKGKTPMEIDLPAGEKYEVRLTLPDYNDWEAQVQLKDAAETPLFVQLMPVDGAQSNPGKNISEGKSPGVIKSQPVEKAVEDTKKTGSVQSKQRGVIDAVITDSQPPVEQDLENLMNEMKPVTKK